MTTKRKNWTGAVALALQLSLLSTLAAEPDLVSVRSDQSEPTAAGGGDSYGGIVSEDGNFVLFGSTAGNLATNSNSEAFALAGFSKINVFVRNRTNATTTLVSMNLAGTGGGNGDSIPTGFSTNGQFALFESRASDLIAGDTNNRVDIFVRDLVNGTNLLVSANTNGVSGNGDSRDAVMTPDGRYVAFVSSARDLVPNDTNGVADVFVRDLLTGTTVTASPGAIGVWPSFLSAEAPEISPDGHYVVYMSDARFAVTNRGELYLRDLVGSTTTRISDGARALLGNSIVSYNHIISEDGRFVEQ